VLSFELLREGENIIIFVRFLLNKQEKFGVIQTVYCIEYTVKKRRTA
jgi:hypothetical protein